jgi:hypothetical protein
MLTRYLNTDLDLESVTDLSALSDDLARRKWVVLHSGQHEDGIWRASFEHLWNSEAGPEEAILGMLDVLERLPARLKAIWTACQKRDFNIGIQSEQQPHAFEQALSNELLARVVSGGASISITVYGTS